MGAPGLDAAESGQPSPAEWQRAALDELERNLQAALGSIDLLRRSMDGGAATPEPAAVAPSDLKPEPVIPAKGSAGISAFERFWDRGADAEPEREGVTEERLAEPRGLDLLPKQYLMTVEDRERNVDLVPLHRALLSLAKMEDISLVSCANGTPVVSLRMVGELDQAKLQEAVSTALDQDCEVIPQDTGRLFLRLSSREGQGD